MPLTVEQRLISRNFRRCTGQRKIEYIVIHYFGSLGTAAAVANYFNTPGIQASAHYCLDEGSTVYQCVEDNNIAWHCGTSGAYVHPRCRNENSIGIEVRPYKLDKSTARSAAPADWYFPPEIVDNLVVFTQMLMQKYNVPLENVVRHYDVTGKWCPRPWMGDDTNTYYGTSGNEQWKKFKERLSVKNLRDGFARNGLLPPIIARAVSVENALSLAEFRRVARPCGGRVARVGARGQLFPCFFNVHVQFLPG